VPGVPVCQHAVNQKGLEKLVYDMYTWAIKTYINKYLTFLTESLEKEGQKLLI